MDINAILYGLLVSVWLVGAICFPKVERKFCGNYSPVGVPFRAVLWPMALPIMLLVVS